MKCAAILSCFAADIAIINPALARFSAMVYHSAGQRPSQMRGLEFFSRLASFLFRLCLLSLLSPSQTLRMIEVQMFRMESDSNYTYEKSHLTESFLSCQLLFLLKFQRRFQGKAKTTLLVLQECILGRVPSTRQCSKREFRSFFWQVNVNKLSYCTLNTDWNLDRTATWMFL